MTRVVIIGAGQAGGETAQRLRQGGFEGAIVLIGEEPMPPYQRPPLSKAYLLGDLSIDRLLLRPAEKYADERIEFLPSARVVAVDRTTKSVRLDGGRALDYDALVIATGATPRRLTLPGAALNGVHVLRTAADVDAMRAAFRPGASLVVIGAGYIGLEAAAVARKRGLNVTVIEAADRPLARVTSPEMSAFFLAEHQRQGVRFLLGATPERLIGEGKVEAVVLASGEKIAADIVIAGIGVTPNTALAEACALQVDNCIVTDAQCRTSDPDIFAIGDCAARPIAHFDRTCRLESVHNAVEGAKIVAAALLGQQAAVETPWFWSDQYDLKLQIAGLFQGYDQIVMRGDPSERTFACFYYKGGRIIAVDAVNKPAEFLGAKMLIQTGRTIAPDLIRDTAQPMKELVAAAAPAGPQRT
ncbi:MAG: oxidoreductase [Hyphomonadaceae bacterium]|nr:oxidoreductase [Hyphomonadaceae bacterium]